MGFLFNTTAIVALLGVIWMTTYQYRVQIPSQLLGHPVTFKDDLITEKQRSDLMKLVKEMKDYPTNANDAQFYKTLHEHIGEAQPINADGSCPHPYLVPNVKRDLCVLAGRVDVGRHYITYGGVEGLKESYDKLVTRVQSFGRYNFNVSEYPVVKALFDDGVFQKAAREVCPKDRQYLDPFQFNFIAQVPGQTVALHLDAPWFTDASRFQYPQWLLAAMTFSGLWDDTFINQVQVVAYLHEWNHTEKGRDGDFVYWDSNDVAFKSVPPRSRAGSAVDGSKTVHAATVYQRHVLPPMLDRTKQNILQFVEGEKWQLQVNNQTIKTYTTDDLRFSVVYRARCFANKAASDDFNARLKSHKGFLELDDILAKFKQDLIKRDRLSPARAENISRLDFGLLILDEYVRYPLSPSAVIPINYCALGKQYPALNSVLALICD